MGQNENLSYHLWTKYKINQNIIQSNRMWFLKAQYQTETGQDINTMTKFGITRGLETKFGIV